ncbi:MAG TPA: polysaccharide deacetylase family protein [Acidobacteriota bacterium]|nr:polysaccharide deacetylase family protein [Acidobacteriota bacterium]
MSPLKFQEQMQYFRENNYTAIRLSQAIDFIRSKKRFGEREFVITFDDGYRSVYTECFPVLRQYGFPATVFLVTDYCGRYNNWPGQLSSLRRLPLLSWNEISEMNRWKFDFGAHTAAHPDLTRVPIERARRQIVSSKARIEDFLGSAVQLFSYPYGKGNAQLKEMVEEEFQGACSTKLAKATLHSDVYFLERIDMYYLSAFFTGPSTAVADWYLALRKFLRESRDIFKRKRAKASW